MNIFVVEDSELIRTQLLRLLATYPEFKVIGTASTETEAAEHILNTPTDAVLLDLSLASGNGLQVLKRIKGSGHNARFLVLTNTRNDLLRDACIAQGASGFYDKSTEIDACLAHLQSWAPAFQKEKTDDT